MWVDTALSFLSNLPLTNFALSNWAELAALAFVAFTMYWAYRATRKLRGKIKFGAFFSRLQLKVLQKLRGTAMSKKKQLEHEKFVREYLAWQWLLSVEQAWLAGIITEADRRKYTDELAFRFSDSSMFVRGRLKMIKKRIKAQRRRLNLPLTLNAAGIDPKLSIGPRKEEPAKKNVLSLVKAA